MRMRCWGGLSAALALVLCSASCSSFREAFAPLPKSKVKTSVPASGRPEKAAAEPVKPAAVEVPRGNPVFLGRPDPAAGRSLELSDYERNELDSTMRERRIRQKKNDDWVFGR